MSRQWFGFNWLRKELKYEKCGLIDLTFFDFDACVSSIYINTMMVSMLTHSWYICDSMWFHSVASFLAGSVALDSQVSGLEGNKNKVAEAIIRDEHHYLILALYSWLDLYSPWKSKYLTLARQIISQQFSHLQDQAKDQVSFIFWYLHRYSLLTI